MRSGWRKCLALSDYHTRRAFWKNHLPITFGDLRTNERGRGALNSLTTDTHSDQKEKGWVQLHLFTWVRVNGAWCRLLLIYPFTSHSMESNSKKVELTDGPSDTTRNHNSIFDQCILILFD